MLAGAEGISNEVPLFCKTVVPNAQRTLRVIVIVVGTFRLGLGTVRPAHHIHVIGEQRL